jgi:predicted small metal-binding protein
LTQATRERHVRVIECDCGATLTAANDDELFDAVRNHVDEAHPDENFSDDQLRQKIAAQAYDATDS